MCARIIFARETKEMSASFLELAKHSHPDSLKTNVADWMTFARITGLHVALSMHKKLNQWSTSTSIRWAKRS
jgi:hypothetical protein